MQFAVLGWPPDGPRLRLDHRRFSYAGKFVVPATGKAVAVPAGVDPASLPADDVRAADPLAERLVAAVAFNADRTDDGTLWLRYVTVRDDRRGEGAGPRLAAFLAARARERGYERARIAVNNPFAYEALYRAGFAFTGDETGLAELVLDRDLTDQRTADPARYREGLALYAERELTADERAFLDARRDADPPARVEAPDGG